jgi:hypothetical protein
VIHGFPRGPGLLALSGCLLLTAHRGAAASNVASVTSVVISQIPLPGGDPPPPPVEMDLDPNDGVTGATFYSIPRGATILITVKGTVAGPGPAHMELMDDDSREDFRGGPDLIEEMGVPQGPGGTFTMQLACSHPAGHAFVSNGGDWDSGERSAELFLRDGDKRIPANKVLPGGKTIPSFWRIDCDSDSTAAFSGLEQYLKTVWGDTLTMRAGALAEPRSIRVSNMYPLRDTESVPPGYGPISEALSLEPHELPLLVPSRLTFQYNREQIGEIADESRLGVFRYDAGAATWLTHPGAEVNAEQDLISVDITELGTYGFAPERPDLMRVWQATRTDFGDNTLPGFASANGSELVAGGAVRVADSLHVFLAGNLETNFNKLEIFLDTGPGGQHRLRGDNPPVDFGGLNRMGDDGTGNGLRFDPDFHPDYWIGLAAGNPDTAIQVFANFAALPAEGGGEGYFLGRNPPAHNGRLQGGFNPHGIRASLDNSNVWGVPAGCGPVSQPDSVWTGLDLVIPLQAIGGMANCVRICAFINGEAHDFVSNQVLGPLPPGTCNLGDPRAIDFGAIAGAQYFEVCQQAVGVPDGSLPRSGAAFPNPFRNRVDIRWSEAWNEPVRIAVFDARGRRIRELSADSGESASWDGRDARGRLVPAGRYFVQRRAGDRTETLAVTRLR